MYRNTPFPRPFATALGALLLLLLSACSDTGTTARRAAAAASAQAVEVVTLERRDITETLNLVGSVAANESAELRTEIAGLVRDIYFDEGQLVKKGDILLKIDDTELVAQTAQAEASFRLAEINLQRSESLVRAKNITQADNDRATSDYNTSKAQFNLLSSRLKKTEIKAPFDGIVGARKISPGDFVTNQTTITVIDDLSRLKIDFEVPERFLRQVKPGTTFAVKTRASADDVITPGEVYFVSSSINRDTRSSEVKGFLTNPPPDLKPGMFTNIELVLGVRKGALTVPEAAVFQAVGSTQVVVVREKEGAKVADFVAVTVGLRSKGMAEINEVKAGTLTEGTPVVASGVGALVLFQGAKVEPRPMRKEFQLSGNGL